MRDGSVTWRRASRVGSRSSGLDWHGNLRTIDPIIDDALCSIDPILPDDEG
jgi:hypothetical protein